MKFLQAVVLNILFCYVTSSTKFVLVGSLGDLAKKYLWSALEENLWNSTHKVEVFGAGRHPASEGEVKLAEILDKLPKRSSSLLDGIEGKLAAALDKLNDGENILFQSKDMAATLLNKLTVAVQEKNDNLMEKLSHPPENLHAYLSDLLGTASNAGNQLLSSGKDSLTSLLAKFKETEGSLTLNELSSTIKNLMTYSIDRLSDGKHVLMERFDDMMNLGKPFKEKVKYLQLKTNDDYANFCSGLDDELVIFYLSIPPSAYVSTSEMINKNCNGNGKKVRVAYEKPFGYSFESAKSLFSSLDELIGNDNIYLIDHYLGKSITQQIPLIRKSLTSVEDLLNKNHVISIGVNLREAADCESRAGYYDKSGVFRDMLQNHATELLALTMADMSGPDLSSAKRKFLESLSVPNKHQVVAAQYHSYRTHVDKMSSTPTFGAVLLFSDLERWRGVPIILTSGKSQAADKKDIEVEFKSGKRLHINFKPAEITLDNKSLLDHDFTVTENSYVTLLDNVIKGDKTLLPDLNTVLASWKVWDHVINLKTNLLLYPNHRDMIVSHFGKFLIAGYTENPMEEEHIKFFNKAFMVSDHEEHLYENLVHDLVRVIKATLEKSDKVHIAVSGGSTILGVYKYLVAYSSRNTLEWKKVHVWQVDERCDMRHANSRDLKAFLLDDIPEIPLSNVHLMPVSTAGCGDVAEYRKEFKAANPTGKFNYVILGLGNDGHTASLFPSSKIISENSYFKLVEASTAISPQRMTITFDLINKSDWVSILVTGTDKREIIRSIKNGKEYPVNYVKNDQLTWFIDEVLL